MKGTDWFEACGSGKEGVRTVILLVWPSGPKVLGITSELLFAKKEGLSVDLQLGHQTVIISEAFHFYISLHDYSLKVEGMAWAVYIRYHPRLWSLLLNSQIAQHLQTAIKSLVWTHDTHSFLFSEQVRDGIRVFNFQQSSGHWSYLVSSMMFAGKMATDVFHKSLERYTVTQALCPLLHLFFSRRPIGTLVCHILQRRTLHKCSYVEKEDDGLGNNNDDGWWQWPKVCQPQGF